MTRRTRRAALILLSMLVAWVFPAPSQAPAQSLDASGHCENGPEGTPQSCNGTPLYAGQRRHRVLNTVGILPAGRVGKPYAVRVVRGGVLNYKLREAVDLPPGLEFKETGFLEGTPTQTGSYHPHLAVRDSANPPRDAQGDWALVIGRPAVISRPAVLPPPPPPPETPSVAQTPPPVGNIIIYRLTKADLTMLDAMQQPSVVAAAPVAAAGGGRAPAVAVAAAAQSVPTVIGSPRRSTPAAPPPPRPPPPPSGVPLSIALAPLLEVEYPDWRLFNAAVRYNLVKASLSKDGLAAANLPMLMAEVPNSRVDPIVDAARKSLNFTNAPSDLHWAGRANCDCVAPPPAWGYRVVYGFLPFWRSTTPGKNQPTVDFSLFDRIGLLGMQLSTGGDYWVRPHQSPQTEASWWQGLSVFARAAQSHRAHLDLVLQGSDWSRLRQLSDADMQLLVSAATTNAMDYADTPLTDPWAKLRWFLFPIWQEQTHVFDGITVMFTPPRPRDYKDAQTLAQDEKSFETFYKSFMLTLIDRMRARGRPYALNIVMNDEPFCKPTGKQPGGSVCAPGAFDLNNLMYYKHYAEDDRFIQAAIRHRLFTTKPDKALAVSQIHLSFIVFISEFTGDAKKVLRHKIDLLENVAPEKDYEGADRVDFLRRIIPVLFEPGDAPPHTPADVAGAADRLRKDLAYVDENFAGVGFWPTPMHGVGNGDAVNYEITREFFPTYLSSSRGPDSADDTQDAKALADNPNPGLRILGFPVSPRRPVCATWVRLSWQFGIVLFLTAVYFWLNGAAQATRTIGAAATVGLGVIMFWLGFLLLKWDPALNDLSVGNTLLLWVLAALGIFLFVLNLIPRVKDP